MVLKLLKINDKETILKASREKKEVTYEENTAGYPRTSQWQLYMSE